MPPKINIFGVIVKILILKLCTDFTEPVHFSDFYLASFLKSLARNPSGFLSVIL
jgi:hypothetical protein